MSMSRWDPFDDMNRLWHQMNRAFEHSAQQEHGARPAQTWAPAVDIAESAEAITLFVELAGVDAKAVDLQLTDDTLTLRGERTPEFAAGSTLLRVERQHGAFHRSFTLGVPICKDAVTARSANGVLEITLPKRVAVQPKAVKIEVEDGE